ncbi:MAG: DUF1413 domain-containing protein, partial [Pseudomonadota bacterium]
GGDADKPPAARDVARKDRLTPTIQARIDALHDGAAFRLKDLMGDDWAAIDNKVGLEAVFARYVARGGRFVRVAPDPGNIAENNLYRRTA